MNDLISRLRSEEPFPRPRFIQCINPNYLDGQEWANSVDPDQTPQNAASDLGLHSFTSHSADVGYMHSSQNMLNLRTRMVRS